VTDTGRQDAQAHIDSLREPRRSHMQRLHDLVLAELPAAADVRMWDYSGPLIGYGTYTYSDRKGRPAGEWFSVGLASRKGWISLFSMGIGDGGTLVATMHPRFPGTKIGKSCINITKPELVDDEAVRELVAATWDEHKVGQPAR